jgi:3'(2'), 5'-bisphosphate nucleotidase
MLNKIDINDIINIAKTAGKEALKIYQHDFDVTYKDDKSPLTEADKKANKIICDALSQKYNNIPILSEENKTIAYAIRKDWQYYWCIDPIDGTKEFIKKNGQWTINIALIHKDGPVLGVIFAPVLDDIYYAKQGAGAFKNKQKLPLLINKNPKKQLTVVASKSHLSKETQNFINKLDSENIQQISKGSSLKLCMVAEGVADIYPRLAPTMEWDTAAAHAVVLEAGKKVLQFDDNKPLIYNKKDLLNPWFVVLGS